MPVTIAASTSTHFLWNGNPMPRVYRVVPHGAVDARLEDVESDQWMIVDLGSTVGGSVPANRDALVTALAGIVSPAAAGGGGGGATASEINTALKGSAQPTRTQVSAAKMIQVQTAANGTSWTAFPVEPCQTITVYNDNVGVKIRVGLDTNPALWRVLDYNEGVELPTPNNSSNCRVKRDDELTTQVTVTALAVL